MLTYLKINNYALIEESEVEFSGGFTVVTGESGAGKSIVMSAIELLCGGRGGKGSIRTGCDRCTLSGIFTVPPALKEPMAALLGDGGLEIPENFTEITLRRVITQSATRNFIDDTPVSSKLLSQIGAFLVDRHGANEQISLTVPARQLELLDNYADCAKEKAACADICRQLADLTRERAAFEAQLPSETEADRLQLMLEEIDRIDPLPNEDEELAGRQRRGANSRQILEYAAQLTNLLTEGDLSIADKLGDVFRMLSELERIDPALTGDLTIQCSDLQNRLVELSNAVSLLPDKVELDPEALNAVEARLSEIYTLKRRYGPTMEQLLESRDAARERLAEYMRSKQKRDEFDAREKELKNLLLTAAKKLSEVRKSSADKFLALAVKKLRAIGFATAEIKPEFTAVAPTANGMDHLELMFSANKGEDLRPLRKIASSGELSRLMLALKTVLADADAVPTVIFDEIDMNIGGETANKVGNELCNLGKNRQIICISHLAQVAARADEHFKVEKSTIDGRTVSKIRKLDDPAEELGRMLGGGASALRHAQELLDTLKSN